MFFVLLCQIRHKGQKDEKIERIKGKELVCRTVADDGSGGGARYG